MRNPVAEMNMQVTLSVRQDSGIPPHKSLGLSIRETPKTYEAKTNGPVMYNARRMVSRVTSIESLRPKSSNQPQLLQSQSHRHPSEPIVRVP
mgnify:CR=1 FL=1